MLVGHLPVQGCVTAQLICCVQERSGAGNDTCKDQIIKATPLKLMVGWHLVRDIDILIKQVLEMRWEACPFEPWHTL